MNGGRGKPCLKPIELVGKTGRVGDRERKVLATWMMACKGPIKDVTAAKIFDACRAHAVKWQGLSEVDAETLTFGTRMISAAYEAVQKLPGSPTVTSDQRKKPFLYSVTPSFVEKNLGRHHLKLVDSRTQKRVEAESKKWRAAQTPKKVGCSTHKIGTTFSDPACSQFMLPKAGGERAIAEAVPEPAVESGARFRSLSLQYKYMMGMAFSLMPTMSQSSFPGMLAVAVRAVVEEARQKGVELTDENIIKFMPSKAVITESILLTKKVDDINTEDFLSKSIAVYVGVDAGNKGDVKYTQVLASAWDREKKLVRLMHIASIDVAPGQLAVVVRKSLGRLSVSDERIGGSCTDSAGDVLRTMVNDMAKHCAYYIGVGCILHILHLLMLKALFAAFGEQVKPKETGGAGENGVLRASFMVHYLIALDLPGWKAWATENGHSDIAFLPTGASEGRWWSMLQAIQDCYKHLQVYCDYFTFVSNGPSSSYTPLYKEVAAWLQHPKLRVDMAYVLAHSETWWNRTFQFFQDSPDWMNAVPVEDRLGGYHADTLPVVAVLLRWTLMDLDPERDPEFATWRNLRDLLPEEQIRESKLQDRAFRKALIEMHAKHFERAITTMLPGALLFPVKIVSVALARALLATIDGQPLPEIDQAVTFRWEDREVCLPTLIEHLMQFTTRELLTTGTVLLLSRPGVVDALRDYARFEGDFARFPTGEWLRDLMESVVYPLPVQSQAVERSVNTANRTRVRSAVDSHEVTEAKTSALSNQVRQWTREGGARHLRERALAQIRELGKEAAAEAASAGISKKWRNERDSRHQLLVITRPKQLSSYKCGKDVVSHILQRCIGQAMMIGDPDFGKKLLSRERRDAAGESRREIHATEALKKVAGSSIKAKQRAGGSAAWGAADRAALAVSCKPQLPQSATGKLNLDGVGKKEQGTRLTKEFIATQLEVRGVTVARDGKGAAKAKLADLLQQLKDSEGGRSVVSWLGGADGEKLPRPWIGGWTEGPSQLAPTPPPTAVAPPVVDEPVEMPASPPRSRSPSPRRPSTSPIPSPSRHSKKKKAKIAPESTADP